MEIICNNNIIEIEVFLEGKIDGDYKSILLRLDDCGVEPIWIHDNSYPEKPIESDPWKIYELLHKWGYDLKKIEEYAIDNI